MFRNLPSVHVEQETIVIGLRRQVDGVLRSESGNIWKATKCCKYLSGWGVPILVIEHVEIFGWRRS